MPRVILLFSRDPGGANTLIPLISPFKKKSYRVLLYGKDRALDQYKKFGFSGKIFSNKDIKAFLKKLHPDIIITGTSGTDMTEKNIWVEARKLNIPTFAILDQWMNIEKRFSVRFIPDTIFVMDELVKNDLIKRDIKKPQIIVSGQPYFEFILKHKSHIYKKKSVNNFIITFVSEPLLAVYNDDLGYTEYSILKYLLDTLYTIAKFCPKHIKLVIKLHPNDEDEKYSSVMDKMYSTTMKIVVDHASNSWDCIKQSDLVCGMTSMVLLESVLLGVPILSVQIGLKTKSPFILDRLGITKSVQNQDSLREFLESAIRENRMPVFHFHPKINAIQMILSTIEKQVWRN